MTFWGSFGLFLALVAVVACIVCMWIGTAFNKHTPARAESFFFAGTLCVWISTLALTFCIGLLLFCFMTGDLSLDYVVNNLSDSDSSLAWLYKISGLWAGREGSLLFWAWLISIFGLAVSKRVSKYAQSLDAVAVLAIQAVLGAFLTVLVFSSDNTPFEALDPDYIADDGTLVGAATMWGMNALLEHWAMAIHPPTLFIGYAGFTVPFAYAIAAAVTNDSSDTWVKRCQSYTIFAWLFLSVGIALGSVWAYVVLGWGGYWGWDPVENASLLPWLIGLALIHSFTVYRQRHAYKRWSLFCACLAFAFVIFGTFISRSGLVSSVHAFSGDTVSTVLLLVLTIAAFASGIIVVLVRRKSFGPESSDPETESLLTKDISYYANNLLMVLLACLIGYLTLTSALPEPLPFAGVTISAGTYNTIARPLGILYCLLMAICPFLSWIKTDKSQFLHQIKIPAIGALIVFAILMIVFVTCLYPNYVDAISRGGDVALEYTDYGPSWYYNGLAIVGLLVASLLFCCALVMLVRMFKTAQSKETHRLRIDKIGGMMAHFAMAFVLVGLIGSSMYVSETTENIQFDTELNTATESVTLRGYELVYTGQTYNYADNYDIAYGLEFDVYKDGCLVGTAHPVLTVISTTRQQKLDAAVLSLPLEDLFVVFQGVTSDQELVMNVKINPLIWMVWFGASLLCVGIALSFIGKVRDKN